MSNSSYIVVAHLDNSDEETANQASAGLTILSTLAAIGLVFTSDKRFAKIWFLIKTHGLVCLLDFLLFVSFLIFLPLHLLVLCGFLINKSVDAYKCRRLEHFEGYLRGEDVFWACEDENSKFIINVLVYVRFDEVRKPEDLIKSIQQRFESKRAKFSKLFYMREKTEKGYFFWSTATRLSVDEYVRKLDLEYDSEESFKSQLSSVVNLPLPAANKSLWECLVGTTAFRCDAATAMIPVVFRVHHSVGDGVTLMKFVLDTFNDDVGKFTIPKAMMRSETFKDRVQRLLINLNAIYKLPKVLLSTALLHRIDENSLHPEIVTGCKKVCWLLESDINDDTILATVKKLRKIYNVHFSHVIFAALSTSLRNYFERKSYDVPKNLTLVVPARLNRPSEDVPLENEFSVAMHNLPIAMGNIEDKFRYIKNSSDNFKRYPEYFVNYWSMKTIASVLPEPILRKVLVSKHATMAFSNLPGPDTPLIFDGYEIERISFFLPNVHTTACGVTLLSYQGKVSLGFLADEAAISCEKDMAEILQGVVDELYAMHYRIMN